MTAIPSGSSPPRATFTLIDTLPGRLFMLSSALLLVILAIQYVVTLPTIAVVFRRVVSAAFLLSGVWLAGMLVRRHWGQFMWRVRRKLILSYLFLGLLPVVLIVVFSTAAAVLLYWNVTAFMFHQGVDGLQQDLRQFVETSAIEIGRTPGSAQSGLDRKYANLKAQYPGLSLAVVRLSEPGSVAAAGAWAHQSPPTAVPTWVVANDGFSGVVDGQPDGPVGARLIVRSAVPTGNGLVVVGDLPIDAGIIARLNDETGTRIDDIAVSSPSADVPSTPRSASFTQIFQQSLAFADSTDWATGGTRSISVQLYAPVQSLYDHLGANQNLALKGAGTVGFRQFVGVLALAGGLLIVVQGSALFFGILLGRQITSAIHELFVGTERVRQGDFTHRITIESRDQLGELAESFNRMSASVAHLLHVQREKQRIDEELRIAHEIQKSLLPVEAPKVRGLDIADLYEAAREVGGDYYDFFMLGPRLVGVLSADVSGKGISAALYMAELKGLMLSLSHAERSPRRLLITVNRLLAAHLDNRSFITMTYAVVDLEAGTLTSARAGHTPMIVVSGGESRVIAPDGMVLGLRLPGANERFEQILQEDTRRIACGDVIVLYTDGITEAMDPTGELFGDERLERVLSSQHHLDAAGIRERVLREVRAFVGDADQHDDMTMVVLKIGARGIG